MSELLHPGPHPDADSLNAFLEGMLPEHERLQCLAHLADCERCREVVFLAQEPQPVVRNPPPLIRPWFAPIRVLSAAAAACVLVVAIWMYLRRTPAPPAREIATRITKTPPVPVSPPVNREPVQPPAPDTARARSESRRSARPEDWPGIMLTHPIVKERPSLPPPPLIPAQQFPPPPAFVSELPQPVAPPSSLDGLSGVTGTVTDPSGAVISRASVTLHQLGGTSAGNVQTDADGKFNVAGLPAGRYDVQITAPGFQQTVMQIDLPPRQVAVVTPTLSVGSVAETVEVNAGAPATLETENASVTFERRALPSKLPLATTVAKGRVMLALDSAGNLFLSRNKGKRWKTVKPAWPGKVVELTEPDTPSTAAFQITTDAGADWLSRDGSHWYPAPVQP